MKKIYLTNSPQVVLVDDEDYDAMIRLGPWQLIKPKGTKTGYAATEMDGAGGKRVLYLMHRLILNMGSDNDGKVVHSDDNDINNQKSNLQILTASELAAGSAPRRNGKSVYKGVSEHRAAAKYQAGIAWKGQKVGLGLFDIEEEAALAYALASELLHGRHGHSSPIPDDVLPSRERTIAIQRQVIKKLTKKFPDDAALSARIVSLTMSPEEEEPQ